MIGDVESLKLALTNLQGALGDLDPETPEETAAVRQCDDAVENLLSEIGAL